MKRKIEFLAAFGLLVLVGAIVGLMFAQVIIVFDGL